MNMKNKRKSERAGVARRRLRQRGGRQMFCAGGGAGIARSEVHRCVSTFAEKEQEMEGGMGLRLYYNGNMIYNIV